MRPRPGFYGMDGIRRNDVIILVAFVSTGIPTDCISAISSGIWYVRNTSHGRVPQYAQNSSQICSVATQ